SVKPKTIEIPFSTVDFLPTILSIFGICEEQNLRFDGHDFSNIIFDSRNVETMKNDLIFMMDGLEDRYALLYKNRYKLIYNRTENIFELYDLEIDPGEIKNIVDVKKELFRKLKMILYDFLYQGFHIYGDVNIFKRVPENEKNY
ncbi:MAG: sulfatase/phosphatase domain-containing protein, partial [Planctomycetota bacterium]